MRPRLPQNLRFHRAEQRRADTRMLHSLDSKCLQATKSSAHYLGNESADLSTPFRYIDRSWAYETCAHASWYPPRTLSVISSVVCQLLNLSQRRLTGYRPIPNAPYGHARYKNVYPLPHRASSDPREQALRSDPTYAIFRSPQRRRRLHHPCSHHERRCTRNRSLLVSA